MITYIVLYQNRNIFADSDYNKFINEVRSHLNDWNFSVQIWKDGIKQHTSNCSTVSIEQIENKLLQIEPKICLNCKNIYTQYISICYKCGGTSFTLTHQSNISEIKYISGREICEMIPQVKSIQIANDYCSLELKDSSKIGFQFNTIKELLKKLIQFKHQLVS